MKCVIMLVPSVVLLAVVPASAKMFGPDYPPCGDQVSTPEIVDCTDAKTKVWDQRLNAAYRNLQQRIDAEQRQPLQAAQRLWVQYRDANCRFYGSGEGTIKRVEAAECMRSMTQDRALELEQAAQP